METGTKGQRGVLQATAERDAFMSDLPPELIRLILLGLWDGAKCIRSASAARRGIEDLLSASLTCKTWNIIIEEEWKALFLSHFSQIDLQICNELQAQSFWGRKPNRDSHLNPYDEIFSVRGDAERAKKEQLEAERNARITSVKHFFIMKVLDPLLVSISANKSILTPNTSTDFKVTIMNRGDKLLSVYKGFGFEHDQPNHFLDGDALHVYSPPTKIEKDPPANTVGFREYVGRRYMCGTGMTGHYHEVAPQESVEEVCVAKLSRSDKEVEDLRAESVMAWSYRKKPRIDPQAEPPSSESEGNMSWLLMQNYMLYIPKEGLCHFYLSLKGQFLSNSVSVSIQ